MAKLNLEFYQNEMEYSDGTATEDEILNIVRSGQLIDFNETKNVSWPVFYHLSHLRENILNWYPFKESCSILEIGSGCGAITGLLCERAEYVTSVELTEKRATINFERHRHYDNLEIMVGNFRNMHFSRKFDYIVVNGVLEYAGGFMASDKPYEEFINTFTPLLNEDGEVLIAIENRLGLKYFSGAKEDHVGKLFVGLNDYSSGTTVRTFSKSEITRLLESCNLVIDKFYYPYPDYKFPEVIYTDNGFEKVDLSYDVHSYDTDRYMFFDEIKMQNILVKEKVESSFANSFLIVARKKNTPKKLETNEILYVKVNANRDPAYRICTAVSNQDGELKVIKHALTNEAINHLKHMNRRYQESLKSEPNSNLLPVKMVGKDLVYDFVDSPTLDKVLLNKISENNVEDFVALLQKFNQMLISEGPLFKNAYSDEFSNYFGPVKCEEDLEFSSFNNVDVLFDNVFLNNDRLVMFDYEWYVNCQLPVKFILWRSIKEFYRKHKVSDTRIAEDRIYRLFEITDTMIQTFYQWEGYFSAKYVKMINLEAYQKKIIYLQDAEQFFSPDAYYSNLYVDTGEGFNDKEKCQVPYILSSNEMVSLEFNISEFKHIKSLRFDPIEGVLCQCMNLHAELDGAPLEFAALNSFPFFSEGDLFLTVDPIYLLNGKVNKGSMLKVNFNIKIIDKEKLYSLIVQDIEIEKQEKEHLKVVYENVLQEAKSLRKELEVLNAEHGELMSKNRLLLSERETDKLEIEKLSSKLEDEISKNAALALELSTKYKEIATLNNEISSLTDEVSTLTDKVSTLRAELSGLSAIRDQLASDNTILAKEYETLINSTIWRSTKPLRFILDSIKMGKEKTVNIFRELIKLLKKTRHNIKTHGWKKTIKKIFIKGPESIANIRKSGEIAHIAQSDDIWNTIDCWIDNTPHSFIDIFHVPMGWNTPLFQRFQHLSIQAGNVGGISFYGAHPLVDKDIEVCQFVSPTLCIVNLDNYEVKKKLFEILDRKQGLKIIRLQSIDLATTIEELELFMSKGYSILYEYIDEITPQITGNIPKFVLDRHDYVLRNEKISVVATSDKLFNQVKPYRSKNMDTITNGVDFEHWDLNRSSVECPIEIKSIVESGKVIIGYHGALAQWIDYDLLKKLASDDRFALLLIGHVHDDHLSNSGLLDMENVHFIGSKPYSELSRYSLFYDIAILPFVVNEITESVSPVKIFEYMAQQKPVVTYALPECLKYKSCLIAHNQQEFIEKIEQALELRFDQSYCQLLKKEALENTWESITRQTIDLVRENQMKAPEMQPVPTSNHSEVMTGVEITKPRYAQDRRLYRALKKVFWSLPIASPAIKQRFLYKFKKSFMPSLLEYSPGNTQKLVESTTETNPVIPKEEIVENEQVKQYIDQILRIPDKDLSEYVPITEVPYERLDGDSKIIAYYLTQFHPDPHNEAWWGKGVTEWNNVCRAVPQFAGHYQPRLPGELGFYDLRLRENLARQIELAQMYGVYGFSFYYYWFDGERLLERPLEMFLADQSLDFPFTLCWANENWTKRFDGTNTDILMEQPKSVESYKNVIHDMVRFLKDKRYITVKGKKMITVYRPALMPEPEVVLEYWRNYCRNEDVGELYIIAVKENMVNLDLLGLGFDAISEFHPGTVYTNLKNITQDIEYIRKDFAGEVFDYKDLVENRRYFQYDLPKLYRAVMPMWDNTARRNNKGMIFQGSTPVLYKQWLKDVIQEGKKRSDLDDQMIFINAWNEWGEGAYLEPDKKYGYAYLQATKEAVEESR
ncbi:glycoside hydrolase family 99-like domain-containing protein [Paenibacillus barengoltzii]|uniref:Lipopolysaccharide biosynthesis protein n=1 Tax=Paenibacillus barengoltzii J12 TaxID=935846 RepID=A0ABY1M196_9BACL|nr:glycoside hydrolase family 99-like domain-containing protein [Paenibacillus barengoltzii]SMF53491.1 Lipopolysaccharide biosynthesis protein [Paenibacillus barengoltzii J12]